MIPKSKLWLDDSREAPVGWVISYDYYSFKGVVEGMRLFSHMSLDHDLSGSVSAPNGYDCVKWYLDWLYLTEKGICPNITIHSMNPNGAKNMYNLIVSYCEQTESECNVVLKPFGDFLSGVHTPLLLDPWVAPQ